jgi:hypothetical protein
MMKPWPGQAFATLLRVCPLGGYCLCDPINHVRMQTSQAQTERHHILMGQKVEERRVLRERAYELDKQHDV